MSTVPGREARRAWRAVAVAAVQLVVMSVVYYAGRVAQAREDTPQLIGQALASPEIVLAPGDLSQEQIRAILVVMDRHFFDHKGSDLPRTKTTITEALTKRFYFAQYKPGPNFHTLRRSLIARFALDPLISKQDQLTLFINTMYLGTVRQGNGHNDVKGLGEAAAVYYSKPFADLTFDEYLSLLVFARPNELNPFADAEANRQHVLRVKALLAG